MKRVKEGCICQTLIFSQRETADEQTLTLAQTRELNVREAQRYRQSLLNKGTRHRIIEEKTLDDGSVMIKVIKEYNEKVDVEQLFGMNW